MLKELADYKASQKKIQVHFGLSLSVSGVILELNPEFIVLDDNGKHVVVAMKHILYFHEV